MSARYPTRVVLTISMENMMIVLTKSVPPFPRWAFNRVPPPLLPFGSGVLRCFLRQRGAAGSRSPF